MSSPRSSYVQAVGDEIHVTEWGDPANPPLVMWHGLARTGRDFDEAALALSDSWFVICPDTLGRGHSSWARDPASDYCYTRFGDHALALLDHYRVGKLAWVGTSMGGAIGIILAGTRLKGRITRLVVNDIGPDIPDAAVQRIITYVGNPPVFATMAELEGWVRRVYAPFGDNTQAFWRRIADTSARRMDDGRVTVHYDPRLVALFEHHPEDLRLWSQWDAIDAATLVLRGGKSDVLPASVMDEMARRGPKPACEVFPEVGHAPTLTTPREIALLREFLA